VNVPQNHDRVEAIGDQLRAKITSKFTASTFLAGFALTILSGQVFTIWQSTVLPFLFPLAVGIVTAAVVLLVDAVLRLDEITMPKRLWDESQDAGDTEPQLSRGIPTGRRSVGATEAYDLLLDEAHPHRDMDDWHRGANDARPIQAVTYRVHPPGSIRLGCSGPGRWDWVPYRRIDIREELEGPEEEIETTDAAARLNDGAAAQQRWCLTTGTVVRRSFPRADCCYSRLLLYCEHL
jgi:hypothetical protein